ncbi:MAG: hypothetical protein JWM11_574 [Planctomycetaceae bacterium]|nr:hypothetical protein [Planctomycetaceae bacterium]
MQDVAETFRATQQRLARRLSEVSSAQCAAIIEEELRGLYHGLFVIFDGGTVLADDGLIQIIDEEGLEFDRFLHEICFGYWPKDED